MAQLFCSQFTIINIIATITIIIVTTNTVHLHQWSKSSEFATQWGIQSTSMNLACAIGPIIAVTVSTSFSWVTSMYAFGRHANV